MSILIKYRNVAKLTLPTVFEEQLINVDEKEPSGKSVAQEYKQ